MSRRNFNAEFKTKVVLESLKEVHTLAEIAKKYKVYPQQSTNWKKEFLSGASSVFRKGKALSAKSEAELEKDRLIRKIGEQTIEIDFQKKAALMPLAEKRLLLDRGHPKLSLSRQCRLLSINLPSLYYKPRTASELNLELMRLMDKHFIGHPYKGSPRMYVYLTEDEGYAVSRNRVYRLYYDVMGLRAIFPGPHTSKRGKGHKVYSYLLRGLAIVRPNQAWATDIT